MASRHLSHIGEREQPCMGDIIFQRTIRGQISADPKLASDSAAAVVFFEHNGSPHRYCMTDLAEVRVRLFKFREWPSAPARGTNLSLHSKFLTNWCSTKQIAKRNSRIIWTLTLLAFVVVLAFIQAYYGDGNYRYGWYAAITFVCQIPY